MGKYVSEETWDMYLRGFIRNLATFNIETKRNRKVLMLKGKVALIQDKKKHTDENVSPSKIVNLIGSVAKSFNRFIEKNEEVELIEGKAIANYTNSKLWRNLEIGDEFYYMDMNHCYWRIAFLLGYISERLYKNTLKKDHMKKYRNMALACTIAPKKTEVYRQGRLVQSYEEDKQYQNIMYTNIRRTAWNMMHEAKELIPDHCLGYRTDGIMYLNEGDVEEGLKTFFDSMNMTYTITKCVKVSEKTFLHGDDPEPAKY